MNLKTFRPRFLLRRLQQIRFETKHPGRPWLAQSAVILLDSYLKESDVGLEWGSGRSTIWFASRVKKMTSIEHNQSWFLKVKEMLVSSPWADRIDYNYVACEYNECDEPEQAQPYASFVDAFEDASLDFALVDGMIRVQCMERILEKIKPGGLLILDNANRFIPNPFGGSHTTVHEARDEPRSARWKNIVNLLVSWRGIHTTDGIWDTRFWVKPNC